LQLHARERWYREGRVVRVCCFFSVFLNLIQFNFIVLHGSDFQLGFRGCQGFCS